MNELEAAIHIRENGPYKSHLGICDNIKYLLQEHGETEHILKDLQDLWMTWPKYSGIRSLPIVTTMVADLRLPFEFSTPSPLMDYINIDEKWDRNTEYGQLRWELLDYTILILSGQQ